jgi:hypothetical protein
MDPSLSHGPPQLSNDLLLPHVTEYLKMSLPLLPFSSFFPLLFLSLSQPPNKVVQPNFLTAELCNEVTVCLVSLTLQVWKFLRGCC